MSTKENAIPSDKPENTYEQLASKLNNLERKLVEQEHRPLKALVNVYHAFITHDDGSEEAAKRKQSAVLGALSAFLWRRKLLYIGGGLIALLTLAVGYFTLREFQKQNAEFIRQNRLFETQNEEFSRQSRMQTMATNGQMVSDLIGDLYAEKKAAGVHQDSAWEIPTAMGFRVLTVSESLEPYDTAYYRDSTNLIYPDSFQTISRERGELLQAVVSLKVDFPLNPKPNFSSSDLSGVNLVKADLSGANLNGTYLSGAFLFRADLSGASLNGSYLRRANLFGANLFGARLHEAVLFGAVLHEADFREAYLKGVNLSGAFLHGAKLGRAFLHGAVLTDATISPANVDSVYLDFRVPLDSLVLFKDYALSQGAKLAKE